MAGWKAAAALQKGPKPDRSTRTFARLTTFVVAYAVIWFLFNLGRMPPYTPGATMDPAFASPQATAALAPLTAALILPGSALACALAIRRRRGRGAPRFPVP